MRTFALVFAAALAAGCATSTRTTSSSHTATPAPREAAMTDANTPLEADAAVIAVRGLSCPKCATGVDQQLAKIRGVRDVNVDFASGNINVSFDAAGPRPTRAQLAQAIEDAGFTLVSITPRR